MSYIFKTFMWYQNFHNIYNEKLYQIAQFQMKKSFRLVCLIFFPEDEPELAEVLYYCSWLMRELFEAPSFPKL